MCSAVAAVGRELAMTPEDLAGALWLGQNRATIQVPVPGAGGQRLPLTSASLLPGACLCRSLCHWPTPAN